MGRGLAARVLVRAAVVCALGGGAGIATNHWSGRPVTLGEPVYAASSSGVAACSADAEATPPKPVPRISQTEARTACDACTAAFVDARGENAYAQGHIPGALHLPPEGHPDEASLLERLRARRTVVVYDEDGAACHLAQGVAQRLKAAGVQDVRVLDGSWVAWEASGAPAESGSCDLCAPTSTQTAQGREARP
jgi:3-mercaptopyruvate sulfurtransferase SseA